MVDRVTVPACSAVARVMHPGVVKYSTSFESGVDSWTNLLGIGTHPHRGLVAAAGATVNGAKTSTRTITGLTSGRRYRFSAWTVPYSALTQTYSLGVTGIGASTPVVGVAFDRWFQVFYEFTATAASHSFELTINDTVASRSFWWDDVLLQELPYQVGADIPLALKEGSTITLDERHAPYAEARLSIALPAEADLDVLDTRSTSQVRVVVSASQTLVAPAGAPQARDYDLLLHEREADHAASGEAVSLVCRSDEALLIDAGNATSSTDNKLINDQKSLRAMVALMLEKHYALLAAGTADADFTITTTVTNQVTNPGGETNVTGWIAASATSTVTRSTAQFLVGSASIGVTATGAGSCGALYGTATGGSGATLQVTPGQTVWASASARVSVARTGSLTLRLYDASNAQVGADVVASPGALSTSAWTRMVASSVVPVGATKALFFVSMASAATGNALYIDGVMFAASDTDIPYFDGTTATDTYYSYTWDGTAHLSTSHRIRLDARDAKLLYQDPGEKDWDVLSQLTQVAGLRLFCDELRVWRLVDPATYIPPGTLALAGAKRGTDKISRESGDWCDAVVVIYNWIGTDGLQKVAYDTATAGGTCLLTVEWNRPYPGVGAAAAILARYQGRGRVQKLDAPLDLIGSPGMALTTSLPNTPDQEGYVSRIQWTLGPFGVSVDARDLVDA